MRQLPGVPQSVQQQKKQKERQQQKQRTQKQQQQQQKQFKKQGTHASRRQLHSLLQQPIDGDIRVP